MGKLRVKLSQRHSKKKLHKPPKYESQEMYQAGLPKMPYIRCGFLQKPPKVLPSMDDKLPQSPVNKKAADIAFPPSRGAAPVTPVPKRWLSLGCDPCEQQSHLLHEDYKVRTRSPQQDYQTSQHDEDTRTTRRNQARARVKNDDWEREMSWKVVARSENQVVRKQVILQKKSSQSKNSNLGLPDSFIPARNSCDSYLNSSYSRSKSGPEFPVYKLTAASPDQSMENESSYAWEKDLSPFASESSIFTSFESLNNKPSSRICVSPDHRRASFLKPSSSGTDAKDSVSCSASPPLAPGHFEDDLEAVSKPWKTTHDYQEGRHLKQEVKHIKKHKDRTRKEKERFTSRVRESLAVEKESSNPYRDFRESMIEMILKKDLFQHRDLEELLRSYLILNHVQFHDLIIQVFTDLWYQLFSYDSS